MTLLRRALCLSVERAELLVRAPSAPRALQSAAKALQALLLT